MKNFLLIGAITASSFISFQVKASDVNIHDYASVKAAIEISTDKFKGTTTTEAPAIDIVAGKSALGGDEIYPVTLSQTAHKSGHEVISATLFIVYTDRSWKNYTAAYSNGQSYDLVDVLSKAHSCRRRNCIFSEIKRLHLTREDLKSAANAGGFKFKVTGQMDSFIVDLPAPYIKAFLDAIDEKVTTR